MCRYICYPDMRFYYASAYACFIMRFVGSSGYYTSVRSYVFCWCLCCFDTKFCYVPGDVCFVIIFVTRWEYVLICYKLYALLGYCLSWFDLCSYVWRFLCCQNPIFLIIILSSLSLPISFLCEMFFLLRRYFCCRNVVLFIEM